jgi:hypothetical protein
MGGVTASTFVDALFAPVNTRPLSGAYNFGQSKVFHRQIFPWRRSFADLNEALRTVTTQGLAQRHLARFPARDSLGL